MQRLDLPMCLWLASCGKRCRPKGRGRRSGGSPAAIGENSTAARPVEAGFGDFHHWRSGSAARPCHLFSPSLQKSTSARDLILTLDEGLEERAGADFSRSCRTIRVPNRPADSREVKGAPGGQYVLPLTSRGPSWHLPRTHTSNPSCPRPRNSQDQRHLQLPLESANDDPFSGRGLGKCRR